MQGITLYLLAMIGLGCSIIGEKYQYDTLYHIGLAISAVVLCIGIALVVG